MTTSNKFVIEYEELLTMPDSFRGGLFPGFCHSVLQEGERLELETELHAIKSVYIPLFGITNMVAMISTLCFIQLIKYLKERDQISKLPNCNIVFLDPPKEVTDAIIDQRGSPHFPRSYSTTNTLKYLYDNILYDSTLSFMNLLFLLTNPLQSKFRTFGYIANSINYNPFLSTGTAPHGLINRTRMRKFSRLTRDSKDEFHEVLEESVAFQSNVGQIIPTLEQMLALSDVDIYESQYSTIDQMWAIIFSILDKHVPAMVILPRAHIELFKGFLRRLYVYYDKHPEGDNYNTQIDFLNDSLGLEDSEYPLDTISALCSKLDKYCFMLSYSIPEYLLRRCPYYITPLSSTSWQQLILELKSDEKHEGSNQQEFVNTYLQELNDHFLPKPIFPDVQPAAKAIEIGLERMFKRIHSEFDIVF
jgi:hypothetical protein